MLRKTSIATVLAAITVLVTGTFAPAQADHAWADASDAHIHPGVQTVTHGGQCTANFVFTDGTDVFIGQAAHCSGLGEATDTNGCDSGSLPVGTKVAIDGATQPGEMVYNSWITMQENNESDANACRYNDFALIKLDPADHGRVNPSIPVWGGPVGVGDETAPFEDVYSYGNSSLRFGIEPLSPKTGYSLGTTGDGWTHPIYTASPGIPGDSGSAILDSEGRAVGVLSTLSIAPLAGSNNATDVGKALAYANAHGGLGPLTLVEGTEAFNGVPNLFG